jgi:hypothetical protein
MALRGEVSMCMRMFGSVTLVVIVLAYAGGLRMADAQTLVLGNEPMSDAEVAIQFNFYSRESDLGGGQGLLKEGTIDVYAAKLYRISTAETSENPRRVLPAGVLPPEYYLVVLPFDLYRAQGARKYRRVIFQVELTDQRITASKLIPQNIFTAEDVKKAYTLGGTIDVKGVGGTVERKVEVTSTHLRPVVTIYGQGSRQFTWEFTSQRNQEIEPGAKEVAAVLEVPRGIEKVSAVITYQLEVQRRWAGDWVQPAVEPAPPSYAMPLSFRGK